MLKYAKQNAKKKKIKVELKYMEKEKAILDFHRNKIHALINEIINFIDADDVFLAFDAATHLYCFLGAVKREILCHQDVIEKY